MSFIFTDQEYETAKVMLSKADELFAAQQHKWGEEGFAEEARKRLGDATLTQLIMAKEDIEIYENLKAGKLPESFGLDKLGRNLTCVRIAAGVTREELAQRLGVDVKVVARNERHEYHGTTLLYAQSVLEALGAKITVIASLS